jgi:1-acyl-sn-glycerol-3-phosphate acyltransferase
MSDPLSYAWYEFWYGVLLAGFTFGWSLRFEGRRNIPRRGPVLLIANHESYIDPLLVGVTAPRHLRFLARKNLFHGLFGKFLSSVGTYPVDQEGVAKGGLKAMIELLQAGQAVLVFPEGERSWTGVMQAFKPGIMLLIKKTLPPVVPVGVAGAFEALPRARRVPVPTLAPLFLPAGRATVAVSVGKPIDSRRFCEMPREQALAELFDEVKKVQERAERLRRKV